jgi:hypothetical protein
LSQKGPEVPNGVIETTIRKCYKEINPDTKEELPIPDNLDTKVGNMIYFLDKTYLNILKAMKHRIGIGLRGAALGPARLPCLLPVFFMKKKS